MTTKRSSKPKSKPASPKAKSITAKRKPSSRSLEAVVGPEIYSAWVSMLRTLVPDGRTHRLSVLIAGMLQYAVYLAGEQEDEDDEKSIVYSLLESTETGDPEDVKKLIHDAVVKLFKDAHVEYGRTSARGQHYSIADDAYAEYVSWYDMPWE